jgi:hypothetical protein
LIRKKKCDDWEEEEMGEAVMEWWKGSCDGNGGNFVQLGIIV